MKRDLQAGRVELAELLSAPPPYAETAMVRDLLLAVRGIGPAKADRTLSRCGIAHAKTVAALSDRQQTALAQLLRR